MRLISFSTLCSPIWSKTRALKLSKHVMGTNEKTLLGGPHILYCQGPTSLNPPLEGIWKGILIQNMKWSTSDVKGVNSQQLTKISWEIFTFLLKWENKIHPSTISYKYQHLRDVWFSSCNLIIQRKSFVATQSWYLSISNFQIPSRSISSFKQHSQECGYLYWN